MSSNIVCPECGYELDSEWWPVCNCKKWDNPLWKPSKITKEEVDRIMKQVNREIKERENARTSKSTRKGK